MKNYKRTLRDNYKFYSQDLLNNLFKHPYTKIEFIQQDLNVSRITAANYLNRLADDKLLTKKKLGTANYYINDPLFKLLSHTRYRYNDKNDDKDLCRNSQPRTY